MTKIDNDKDRNGQNCTQTRKASTARGAYTEICDPRGSASLTQYQYNLVISESASEDLNSLALYIARSSASLDTAINYVAKLEESLRKLSDYPLMGVVPKLKALRLRDFRMLIIESHIAFYNPAAARL